MDAIPDDRTYTVIIPMLGEGKEIKLPATQLLQQVQVRLPNQLKETLHRAAESRIRSMASAPLRLRPEKVPLNLRRAQA